MNAPTNDLIPLLNLDGVDLPIHEATGMPNAIYTDPAMLALERQKVFDPTWACIGFASDVNVKGAVKPIDFMGMPLLLVRDKDEQINVFHNVCSHRGVQLVDEPKVITGMLCCPYHSWTYDLKGALKVTPHIGGMNIHTHDDFDCAKHGLKAVRTQVWMGLVFVNLSGDAAPFEDRIEPLLRRWDEFFPSRDFESFVPDLAHGDLTLDIACNWKLAVENYCEAYHLPWVHPDLNTYSKLEDHYNIEDETFSGQGSHAYRLSEHEGFSLPRIDGWPAERIENAEYISLFPNVLLGLQADHAFAMVLMPNGQEQVQERLRLFYVDDSALADDLLAARQSVLDAWRVVFSEDVGVVEAMQKGRHSAGFAGGAFSPVMDGPTHAFHKWLARQYKNN